MRHGAAEQLMVTYHQRTKPNRFPSFMNESLADQPVSGLISKAVPWTTVSTASSRPRYGHSLTQLERQFELRYPKQQPPLTGAFSLPSVYGHLESFRPSAHLQYPV